MPRYLSPPAAARTRTAVLLVNLGTPDAPDTASVRRYLAEFLSDPRIVEQPRWLWLPILYGVILRLRPRRSAHAYRSIWTPAGSPLLTGTRALAERVQAVFGDDEAAPLVRVAMRYGNPSIAATLRELAAAGMGRLLVLPLFPQYSATTAASVLDAVGAELRGWRWPPELRVVNDYHVEPAYLDALARSIGEHWQAHGRGERLLLSFHGIPQRYVHNGDPYFAQCQATADALRGRLDLDASRLLVTFQSRVGREPWLQPYTDLSLDRLAAEGVRRLDVACPGFSIDCLETLEEIAITNRARFLAAGGEQLNYIAALNDRPDHAAMIVGLIRRHLAGWEPAVATP